MTTSTVIIQEDHPITLVESPAQVSVTGDSTIVIEINADPILVKYQTQKGDPGYSPTAEDVLAVVESVPEFSGILDLSTPPALANLVVTGGFATIQLQWDFPSFTAFKHVQIWRAESDNRASAVLVATSESNMFADRPLVSGIAKQYFYWIKCVSIAGVIGPFNQLAGTAGVTANDPSYVLAVLSDLVTESQLHHNLKQRIDLVDVGNASLITLLDNLSVATAGMVLADTSRWEELAYHRQVFDAIVDVDPGTGTITLKATAAITTDIEASLVHLQGLYNAQQGLIGTTVDTVAIHGADIESAQSDIIQLGNQIAEKVSSAYVDNAVADLNNTAELARYAAEMEIPIALAALVLNNQEVNKVLMSSRTRVAIAERNISTNADAISAEAAERLLLATVVSNNYASLVAESLARSNADSAEAALRSLLNTKVDENQAALELNYYTKSSIDSASAGWIASAVSTANANTASLLTNYYTATEIDSASSGWISSAVSEAAGHVATVLEDYSTLSDLSSAVASTKVVLGANLNKTFVSASAPTKRGVDTSVTPNQDIALETGDRWIDSDDGNKEYVWNSATWVLAADSRLTENTAKIAEERSVRASSIAPDFDSSIDYPAKSVVMHSGGIYRASQAIAKLNNPPHNPNNWNGVHWTPITADLLATWTLRTDVNGKVSGVGLSNDGEESLFEVICDRFAVLWSDDTDAWSSLVTYAVGTVVRHPDAGQFYRAKQANSNQEPQVVDEEGTPLPDGNSFWQPISQIAFGTDPAYGLVIDTALIKNGSIGGVKIGTAAIDTAKIADAAIVEEKIGDGQVTSLKIGNVIKSTYYNGDDDPEVDSGTRGWCISKAGSAVFNHVGIRDDVSNNAWNKSTSVNLTNASSVNGLSGIDFQFPNFYWNKLYFIEVACSTNIPRDCTLFLNAGPHLLAGSNILQLKQTPGVTGAYGSGTFLIGIPADGLKSVTLTGLSWSGNISGTFTIEWAIRLLAGVSGTLALESFTVGGSNSTAVVAMPALSSLVA